MHIVSNSNSIKNKVFETKRNPYLKRLKGLVQGFIVYSLYSLILFFPSKGFAEEDILPNTLIFVGSNIPLKNADNSLTDYGLILEDIAKKFKEEGIKFEYRIIPWARIIIEAPKQKNALIFQMIRTIEREDNYHWLMPLGTDDNALYLYTRNEAHLKALTQPQITSGQYNAICHTRSAQCDMLKKYGFSEENIIIVPVVRTGSIVQLVARKRASFFIEYQETMKRNLIIQKLDENTFHHMLKFATLKEYLSAPKHIHPDLLIKIKKALASPEYPLH